LSLWLGAAGIEEVTCVVAVARQRTV